MKSLKVLPSLQQQRAEKTENQQIFLEVLENWGHKVNTASKTGETGNTENHSLTGSETTSGVSNY